MRTHTESISLEERVDSYQEEEEEEIFAGLEFKSLPERIESMSHRTEMVGELEIIWMSESHNRQIHVTANTGNTAKLEPP